MDYDTKWSSIIVTGTDDDIQLILNATICRKLRTHIDSKCNRNFSSGLLARIEELCTNCASCNYEDQVPSLSTLDGTESQNN